ncbi:MAG: hypothetical protein U0939_22710 [Pirellulales bacterium]
MKIATSNILKGGSRRTHWEKMVKEHGVDLLLVQESNPPDEHLPPLMFPTARNQSVWENAPPNGWGSGIYAVVGAVSPVAVPGFAGWVVGAKIEQAFGGTDTLLAFSIHAPNRGDGYANAVNSILNEIKKVAEGRTIVIGGDFNLSVSYSSESERPVSKQDLAIQARLSDEFGLLNCWQTANPNQSPKQTLRWTVNRETPYHVDGLFVPKSWGDRLQSCEILSGGEWDQLSDHNPVVACFS